MIITMASNTLIIYNSERLNSKYELNVIINFLHITLKAGDNEMKRCVIGDYDSK